ncbi:MAG: outer membrane protein assembly factor BamA [Sedimentisphaerales bacterium]|nr:outer membrane protein assembly factor BamA [Sedimentisphaerales bacterium]
MARKDRTIMKRSLSICFAALFCCGCLCFGQEGLTISSIEIEGNVTVSRSEILAAARAKVGRSFYEQVAKEDIDRIAAIEGIEYAYYAEPEVIDGQVKLTYVVVEKNLVRSITFTGNKKFKEGKLTKELNYRIGDYLDIFKVRSGAEAITELYRKTGYSFVEVASDESRISEGNVVYIINEGPRVKVKGVKFAGGESIPPKELQKAIKTNTKKYFVLTNYFNEETLAKDIIKLQEAYQDRGFMNATVTESREYSNNKKEVVITFSIVEGIVYTVKDISITGNEFLDSETLQVDTKLKEGSIFSRAKGEFDAKKMQSKYLEQGYINAEVEFASTFPETGKASVKFKITEGDRFRIGQIVITGNEMTHDKVVRRILDSKNFKPGQWYNADIARGNGQGELEKGIKSDLYAESAFIKTTGDAPDQRDAHVNIVEGRTGSIALGAGIDTDSGIIGQFTYDQKNFDINDKPENLKELFTGKAYRGAGQHFRVALEPGTVQSNYSVSFTEPYLYDKPVSLNLSGSSFEREWERVDDDDKTYYEEHRLGGYLELAKTYPDKWTRGIAFRVVNVKVDNVYAQAPKEIKDVKGDNLLGGVKLFVSKKRTSSRSDMSFEQVGGDHTFGVLAGTHRWYKTLHEDLAERKTILETKIHGSTIVGDAPPFEKFYAGGHSLRGFEYRGISTRGSTTSGPARKDDPIGSKWLILSSAEVTVPLTTDVFSALFFVDAGMIDSGGVRAAIGTGLQISPDFFAGARMRFEFATPIMKESDDQTQVFSFSIKNWFY